MGTDHESGYLEIVPWDFHHYMQLVEEDNQIEQELVSEYFPPRENSD